MSACFYTNTNYTGNKQCINSGQFSNVTYDNSYSSATIPPKSIAFLYEHPNFEGEILRIDKNTPSFQQLDKKTSSIKLLPDCHNSEFTWNTECDYNRNLFPQLDTVRSTFCNANRTNSLSQKCMSWCNENRGKCSTLNNEIACNKYNIPQSKCTDNNILNIEKQCIQFGLIDADSKTTTSRSIYQCNDNGIKTLKQQCAKFNIDNTPECTSANIENKLTEELFKITTSQLIDTLDKQSQINSEQRSKANDKLLEFLQTSQTQSQSTSSQISESHKAESDRQLDRAYLLLQNISTTSPKPQPTNYTQTYVIIALIFIIFIILAFFIKYKQ